ncbi:MAG: DEAD/DEAH box helicase family protein [Verrucomicrobiaceae bacterium]|nr:DEAD/DEAH box helicase family protein [Verrucomicrobiaceae bacterium]
MEHDEIAAGIAVFHRANPGRLGVLTGRKERMMFWMAEVDWGNQFEFADVSQLVVRNTKIRRSMDDDVRDGRYGRVDDLRRRITFEKLRGMLTDVFYSMKTSEIDFYAHQFKPVLRFIESATNRLLIADEVGLGKTIEAGLIWTEWQAREKARRLLVVCPPTLVPKWLRELQDRFQLAAEATDAKRLVELLERFDRKGPGMSFVLVTSYHALRPFKSDRDLLQRLRDAAGEETADNLRPRTKLLHRVREQGDEARNQADPKPFFDMVVFDEAHSMKNTASASYVAGEILSAAAGAAVCLSATPIHNASRDLYALMRLIDPEVFRDEFVFDLLRQQNLPVVQLQNALAAAAWQPAAIEPFVVELPSADAREQMADALRQFDGSPRARVELRHLAERMNLLGNFINRTRKRDVIENRVIRQPVTLPVTLTNQESAFYRAVLKLVRSEVRSRGDSVTSFHLIHPALKMASSLPVTAAAVAEGKWGGFEEMEEMAEDFAEEFDFDDESNLPTPEELRSLSSYDFAANDSKYAELRKALRLIGENKKLRTDKGTDADIAAGDKVIIFAFFKATIAYLQGRLQADGIRTVAVTGDIKDRAERDKLLRGFETDDNRILLCSEIGAEGVDLQFARVVVNYDLPWNPMRVEQRIGRIDRIGQKAPSIVVINFHVRDTIDGSIYTHLYAKIGIFEQSIGALEGILGEEVAKLTSQIFRQDLTMEQVAEQAEQTADAVCQRAQIESELENSTGALIAFQDLLSEQIGESQRLGRFIKPDELRLHAEDFFSARYTNDPCLLITDNPVTDCIECKLSHSAMSDFDNFCHQQDLPWPDGFSRTTRVVRLTFDPAVHQQYRRQHRGLVLVTHLHPFFRWITKENESKNNEWHKVSAVRVQADGFSAGRHFYLVYRMTMEGITRRDAFYYVAKCLPTGEVLTGTRAESLLNAALDKGESAFPRQTADHSSDLAELRATLVTELKSVQRMFRDDQAQKLAIRRQQLNAHFNRRIEAQRRRIATAEERQVGENQLRGFRTTLANLEVKQKEQLAKLQDKAAGLKETPSEVACGFIDVEPCGAPSS